MLNSSHTFATRMQAGVEKEKVARLRRRIQEDVELKQQNDQSFHFRTYSKFSVSLPPLSSFPDEFRQQFMESLIDMDMKDELEHRRAINWCTGVKPLLPLKTTAEGNCLLHAVSQYMWAIEDDDLFLRRLLYVTMTTDPIGQMKKRWIYHQRTSPETEALGGRIDTQDIVMEWDAVIRATEDVARTGNGGLPYACLESIHLYVLANLLRRPIIVLADLLVRDFDGRSMQENTIAGIYLPLDCNKTQCDKNPIVIGYYQNHFVPLVGVESIRGRRAQVIPIVTHDFAQLPVRYLLPNEEHCVTDLIPSYLSLTEVAQSDGGTAVPAAKLSYNALPNDMNITNDYRVKCEQTYRRMLDVESGYRVNQQPIAPVEPFNFNVAIPEPQPPAMNIASVHAVTVVPTQLVVAKVPRKKRTRCITVGCKMYGSPETSNLCSKCFNEFTVMYQRQEEAGKKEKERYAAPVLPVQRRTAAHEYTDLSVMGEDCQARCGFKCSTETFPYCHECYPLYGRPQGGDVAAAAPTPQNIVPVGDARQSPGDYSLLPDDCRIETCMYKASKATFPYCHECFDKLRLPISPAHPTAPPVSVPVQPGPQDATSAENNLQLNIHDDDETRVIVIPPTAASLRPVAQSPTPVVPSQANWNNLSSCANVTSSEHQMEPMAILQNRSLAGELPRKCKVDVCDNVAIRGNDGFCDTCYNNVVLGGNVNVEQLPEKNILETLDITPTPRLCATHGCKEELMPGTTQCTACFVQHGSFPIREPEPVAVETPMATQNANLNILMEMSSEKEKNTAIGVPVKVPSNTWRPLLLSLPRSFHGEASQHDETSHITSLAAKREIISYPPSNSETYRKHICAKAGCQGVRLADPSGLCYACMQAPSSPVPTPVVRNEIGAKQGHKSPSSLEESTPVPSCSPYVPTAEEEREMNPVVTSSKQKVKCVAAICDKMIYPPKKLCDSCTEAIELKFAEKSKNVKRHSSGICVTTGCNFHGDPLLEGYCSNCSKEKTGRQETSKAARPRHHTAPILQRTSIATEETQRHTAPILQKSHKYVVAQKCIEVECERYGDPSQAMRCSQHYEQAMARKPPMPMEYVQLSGAHGGIPIQSANIHSSNVPANQNGYANVKTPASGSALSKPASGIMTNVNVNTQPSPDPFITAISKVESSRKNTTVCKNSRVTGCTSYGNSSKGGYCNACYPIEIQRQLQANRVLSQGQNQIG